LGEENVNAFIDNNIIRTRRLFAEAYKHCADIIFISTDKAVEPINLYGMTKAIGEYLAKEYEGYIARCGNFLNSSGSVIPVWEKAIREGKPIKVTDKRMKRFVIDVDYAAQEIWKGYLNKQKLIIPNCQEKGIMELLNIVSWPSDKVEYIGIRKGEKLQEKLRWDWEKETK
jgi:UDP-N-acetylglucosamine 4,6-dehydratase